MVRARTSAVPFGGHGLPLALAQANAFVRRVEEDSKWLGFDILCFRVFPDVSHESHAVHCGCLLPRQTGRAAFPHPAFAGIVALGFAGSCATVARRGRQPSC